MSLFGALASRRLLRTRRNSRVEPRGQAAVEFALVFPIFIMLIIGMIEFAFAFNALLSINFASRDATLLAAEAASDSGADCIILNSIETDVTAPADVSRIDLVRIYWSDQNGVEKANSANVYDRTGSMTCIYPDSSTITVPYSLVGAAQYPETARCDVIDGCPGAPPHPTVDTIGVSITYHHFWMTPLAGLVSFGGDGFTFSHSNAMRMEPAR